MIRINLSCLAMWFQCDESWKVLLSIIYFLRQIHTTTLSIIQVQNEHFVIFTGSVFLGYSLYVRNKIDFHTSGLEDDRQRARSRCNCLRITILRFSDRLPVTGRSEDGGIKISLLNSISTKRLGTGSEEDQIRTNTVFLYNDPAFVRLSSGRT